VPGASAELQPRQQTQSSRRSLFDSLRPGLQVAPHARQRNWRCELRGSSSSTPTESRKEEITEWSVMHPAARVSLYMSQGQDAVIRGEIFNSATHMAGSLFAAGGLAALLAASIRSGDPRKIVSFAIYGSALVALYLFSTLYHALSGRAKRIFRRLDHTGIYVLIAGTYTPFAAVSLRRSGGTWLLAVVWFLAAAGILQEFLLPRRVRPLSVGLYLLMGWMALVAAAPLYRSLGAAGMVWLIIGGLLYTAGVFFYLTDEKYAHSHGVFHLFVLGGSIAHFVTVILYVA